MGLLNRSSLGDPPFGSRKGLRAPLAPAPLLSKLCSIAVGASKQPAVSFDAGPEGKTKETYARREPYQAVSFLEAHRRSCSVDGNEGGAVYKVMIYLATFGIWGSLFLFPQAASGEIRIKGPFSEPPRGGTGFSN